VHTPRHIRKNSGFSTQEEHIVLLGLEARTGTPNLRYATRSTYEGLQYRAFTDIPPLLCPQCGEHLGVPIIYQKEQRLAFRLFAGAVTTKIRKRHSKDPTASEGSAHRCQYGISAYPPKKGSVSNVEMVTPRALTYKVLLPSISVFETSPPCEPGWVHIGKKWSDRGYTADASTPRTRVMIRSQNDGWSIGVRVLTARPGADRRLYRAPGLPVTIVTICSSIASARERSCVRGN